jgi:hypothetical protein
MFGWKKKDSGPTEAQLRDAYIKRLVEVLGLPNIEPIACEASPQESFKPSPDPAGAFDESFLKLVGISGVQDETDGVGRYQGSGPEAKLGISTPK